jgi:predicted RNA binding protein YcfA (HicA-like mRNA interferase family)
MPAIKPVSYQVLVRIFEQDGFTFDRQKGDHLIYTKPGTKRPIVIPMYSAVPVFIIKNVLRTSGMTRERYFDLLNKG